MKQPDTDIDRAQLRRRILAQRGALSASHVTRAAGGLAQRVTSLPSYHEARRLAAYLAMPGEMDTAPCMRAAILAGKHCYVPVLSDKALCFAPWSDEIALCNNRFGIAEPDVAESELLAPEALDLVLVPLVAFDAACNRLGMGGGYYDRTFAARRSGAVSPVLIGVAHQLQKVERLAPQWWDVPLDAIATDKSFYSRPPASAAS